jgi:hypothetical protein
MKKSKLKIETVDNDVYTFLVDISSLPVYNMSVDRMVNVICNTLYWQVIDRVATSIFIKLSK